MTSNNENERADQIKNPDQTISQEVYCNTCDNLISQERLRVLPHTTDCIVCANIKEQRRLHIEKFWA